MLAATVAGAGIAIGAIVIGVVLFLVFA